jgi:hypothetical protein
MVRQNPNANAAEKKVYGFPKNCISGVPMSDQTIVDGTLIREHDGFAQFRYEDGTVKQIKPICFDIFDERFRSTGGKRRSKSKRRRVRKSRTLKRK